MLERLLSSLFTDAKSAGVDLDIHVYDDGSTEPIKADRCTIHRREENGGKKLYWKLVNEAFTVAYRSEWKYFYMLPDDGEIVEGFFARSVAAWQALRGVACLSVCTDRQRAGKLQWGDEVPKTVTRSGIAFWTSGWVDMAFMCERSMFDALKTGTGFINPIIRDVWKPGVSSGVGGQITKRLRLKGQDMLHVHDTLINDDGKHESRMHPETRKTEPLSTGLRIGLLTCLWAGKTPRRARLACLTLTHNASIRVSNVELILIAVYSPEDPNITPALFIPGWIYVRFPNFPMSDKWCAGAEVLRRLDVDAMMIFGSDDFLNREYIEAAVTAIRNGANYVMPKSLYFYDSGASREAIYCTGIGRVGGGRTLSRHLLDKLDWKPWEPGYKKNIDGCMDRRLIEIGHKHPDVTIDNIRDTKALLLGIKTGENMHGFHKMKVGLKSETVDARALLTEYVPLYAEELLAW